MPRRTVAALLGLLAAIAGVVVADLVANIFNPAASPLVAVGNVVVDATPAGVKEWAVATLGTLDKPLLLGGVTIALAVFAAVIGLVAVRRLPIGLGLAALFGVVGVAAALTRPAAEPIDVVPSIVGGLVAVVALFVLVRAAMPAGAGEPATGSNDATDPARSDEAVGSAREADSAGDDDGDNAGSEDRPLTQDRRKFLVTAGTVTAVTAAAGAGAFTFRRFNAADAARSRDAVRLPAAADPAKPLPKGIAPGFVTSNKDFYRVDTALTVPKVDAREWTLRIHGMVDKPVEYTFDDLLKRPLTERDITLNCVSNEVGGPYIGTARWLGVPMTDLLKEAGVKRGANQIIAKSTDGMTIGTPVENTMDGRDAMIAIGMNGEPLPLDHGFPARMLTPGLYGYVGACKWIVDIELSTFDDFDAYWVRRGYAAEAPVKTASRIDRPAPFAKLDQGTVTVAGVAWAQTRGISKVELSIDNGTWTEAELLPVPSTDTWVQWKYQWAAKPGGHSLRVRATDGKGDTQTEDRAQPFPDGATGWHSVVVTVN